jgi:hypothetical protein
LLPELQSRNSFPAKILNSAAAMAMPNKPSPEDLLEAARLEAARQRVDMRLAAVKENTAFLEQALKEIKQRTA